MNDNKIITFPASLYGHKSSIDGGVKFTLDVPESAIGRVLPLIAMQNKNFFVTIEPVNTEQEYLEKERENPAERRSRYNKKMHALMRDLAGKKGITKEKVEEQIKNKLIKEGKIKESTTEMSHKELLEVINRLESVLYPVEEGPNQDDDK